MLACTIEIALLVEYKSKALANFREYKCKIFKRGSPKTTTEMLVNKHGLATFNSNTGTANFHV